MRKFVSARCTLWMNPLYHLDLVYVMTIHQLQSNRVNTKKLLRDRAFKKYNDGRMILSYKKCFSPMLSLVKNTSYYFISTYNIIFHWISNASMEWSLCIQDYPLKKCVFHAATGRNLSNQNPESIIKKVQVQTQSWLYFLSLQLACVPIPFTSLTSE